MRTWTPRGADCPEWSLSPRLAAFVLQEFSSPEPPSARDVSLETLTPREREVLHHDRCMMCVTSIGRMKRYNALPGAAPAAATCFPTKGSPGLPQRPLTGWSLTGWSSRFERLVLLGSEPDMPSAAELESAAAVTDGRPVPISSSQDDEQPVD